MPPGPDNEPTWSPRIDVLINSAGDLTIKVELAALRREDLELGVEGTRLTIIGRRPDADRDSSTSRYLLTQIPSGRFDASVDVPVDFDLSKAKARYQNGILRVTVPQAGSQWADRPA